MTYHREAKYNCRVCNEPKRCGEIVEYKRYKFGEIICRECNQMERGHYTCCKCGEDYTKAYFNPYRFKRGEIICWNCNKEHYGTIGNISKINKPTRGIPKRAFLKPTGVERIYVDSFGREITVRSLDMWVKSFTA